MVHHGDYSVDYEGAVEASRKAAIAFYDQKLAGGQIKVFYAPVCVCVMCICSDHIYIYIYIYTYIYIYI